MLIDSWGNPEQYAIPEVRRLKFFPEPQSLDDLIIADPWGSRLKSWIRNIDEMPPATLIYGPPGCGKTSIIRVLSKTDGFVEYADDNKMFMAQSDDTKILYLNINSTTANNGVEMLKGALDIFYKASNRASRTLLVVDEAHDLSDRAINILKPAAESLYEKFENSTFGVGGNIILLSTKDKLSDMQLMSRLIKVNAGKIDSSKIIKLAIKGLKENNIEFDEQTLNELWLSSECPREFLNTIQYNIVPSCEKTGGKLENLY